MRVGRKPRGNPFSTCHVRPGAIEFRFPQNEDKGTLASRLERQEWRGQIVGPHGSGKSTLLAALLPELRRRRSVVLVELHEHQRRLPADLWASTQEPTLLVIDGFEQLRWWTRWRVCRHCWQQRSGLLVTTHRNLRLPDLYRTRVTVELAQAIVEGLLGDDPAWPLGMPDLARQLFRHRGNLRDVMFELYDHFESIDRSV